MERSIQYNHRKDRSNDRSDKAKTYLKEEKSPAAAHAAVAEHVGQAQIVAPLLLADVVYAAETVVAVLVLIPGAAVTHLVEQHRVHLVIRLHVGCPLCVIEGCDIIAHTAACDGRVIIPARSSVDLRHSAFSASRK